MSHNDYEKQPISERQEFTNILGTERSADAIEKAFLRRPVTMNLVGIQVRDKAGTDEKGIGQAGPVRRHQGPKFREE